MPLQTHQIPDPIDGQAAGDAPAPALQRPQKLKKWASDLVKILNGQENAIFDGWDFRENRLTRADFTKILEKIQSCGSVVELRAAVDHGTGEIGPAAVHAANFCGQHAICPYCAGRVQDRRGAKWERPLKWAAEKYVHAYMVTATTAPAETWREDLAGLRDAWRKFQLAGQKGRGGEWGKVRAGLAKVELKRGSGSGLPHCHYHAIVFSNAPLDYRIWNSAEKKKKKEDRQSLYKIPWKGGYIPASKIAWEWWKASGLTSVNIDVRPLKGSAESIYYQSREVLKYATKFDSHPGKGQEKLFAADFLAIKEATYSRRLFAAYGSFRAGAAGEVCPHLSTENDFTGGGPALSDGPAIYESRWRGVVYSPLILRSRPVFKGTDKSLFNQYRWTMLNRCMGRARKIRAAVLRARKHYQETGELEPAQWERVTWDAHWNEKRETVYLEIPAPVAAAPADWAAWEGWIDHLTESAGAAYKQLRDSVDMELNERIHGTLEERKASERRQLTALWRSDEYQERTIREFIYTINKSQEMINGPP